jgi:hypothetical protein
VRYFGLRASPSGIGLSKERSMLSMPRMRADERAFAYELRGKFVGDGLVHRACAKVLKESGMFDPPELDCGRMPRISKWDR